MVPHRPALRYQVKHHHLQRILQYFLNSIEEVFLLNDIDQKGRAIDPESGEPIGCKTKSRNQPSNIYRGKSAKQLGIQISEGHGPFPISHLDHAIYIGRELQRAEQCLTTGKQYIQD